MSLELVRAPAAADQDDDMASIADEWADALPPRVARRREKQKPKQAEAAAADVEAPALMDETLDLVKRFILHGRTAEDEATLTRLLNTGVGKLRKMAFGEGDPACAGTVAWSRGAVVHWVPMFAEGVFTQECWLSRRSQFQRRPGV